MKRKKSSKSKGISPSSSTGQTGSGATTGTFRVWVQAKRPVLGFVLGFAFLMALFYGITFIPFMENTLLPKYMRFNATAAATVMNVFGENAKANGTQVSSPRPFSVDIAQGCDAVEPTALFIAAVLAFPAPFRSKFPGVIVGGLSLALMNLVRIVSLFYTGAFYPRAFDIMHVDVWQPIFILLALTFWVIWAWWATKERPKKTYAPAQAD